MKVQPGNVNSHLNIGTAKGDGVDAKSSAKSSKGKVGDLAASATVKISEQAQMINKAKEMATPDMDSVREDRVSHFQKLIDGGDYEIDASSIADRLVDEHLIR